MNRIVRHKLKSYIVKIFTQEKITSTKVDIKEL